MRAALIISNLLAACFFAGLLTSGGGSIDGLGGVFLVFALGALPAVTAAWLVGTGK